MVIFEAPGDRELSPLSGDREVLSVLLGFVLQCDPCSWAAAECGAVLCLPSPGSRAFGLRECEALIWSACFSGGH